MSSRVLVIGVFLLAVAAACSPVDAQQVPKIPKIGLLLGPTAATVTKPVEAFKQGLRELGYVEGKGYILELRCGEGKPERLLELSRELVRLKVDVIVASTDAVIAALKRETRTIPIVMAFSTDPAGTGFVASLARPGGSVTGLSNISAELSGKRLELLREVVPGLSRTICE
jgi:putative tryptophan/tyrosine transport system substrate-binding protein